MKLSEKGKSRIHEMIDCAFEAHPDDAKGVQVLAKKYLTECDDFELEPDDFQGVVCLTVEEANLLFNVIDGFFDLRLPTTKEIVALNKLKVRVERIEQAEKKDE